MTRAFLALLGGGNAVPVEAVGFREGAFGELGKTEDTKAMWVPSGRPPLGCDARWRGW